MVRALCPDVSTFSSLSNVLLAPDCNYLEFKRKRVFVEYFNVSVFLRGTLVTADAGWAVPPRP